PPPSGGGSGGGRSRLVDQGESTRFSTEACPRRVATTGWGMHEPADSRPSAEQDSSSAVAPRDEHPSIVVQDIMRRRRPDAHVIVFANEKGGVGKSTLAFHCALALAHAGKRVLAIDCDRRQQTLHHMLEARDATMRTLRIGLPRPDHTVLLKQSGALLLQEIERLGN